MENTSKYEGKNCPRCGQSFTCKPGNITHCQCHGILLSEPAKEYLRKEYEDCVSADCLEAVKKAFPIAAKPLPLPEKSRDV